VADGDAGTRASVVDKQLLEAAKRGDCAKALAALDGGANLECTAWVRL
jgi:hypothetical protein